MFRCIFMIYLCLFPLFLIYLAREILEARSKETWEQKREREEKEKMMREIAERRQKQKEEMEKDKKVTSWLLVLFGYDSRI